MALFPRVWLDSDTSWLQPGCSPEELLTRRGYALVSDPADADVLVCGSAGPVGLAAAAGIGIVLVVDASFQAVGGIWADRSPAGPTVLTVGLVGVTAGPLSTGLHPSAAALGTGVSVDLLARVQVGALTPTARLSLTAAATPLLTLPSGAPVAATCRIGRAPVVVLGVLIDQHAADLLFNAITYAAKPAEAPAADQQDPMTAHPGWLRIKSAVSALRLLQSPDGSIAGDSAEPRRLVGLILSGLTDISPLFAHDSDYLAACGRDLLRWSAADFDVPDFLDSLLAFHPQADRQDGRRHLVLFPMYTQNGNPDRNVEAVLIEVIWPEFIADLEAGDYSNKLFLPIRFLDFTAGYDTNSAVLFPETIAMREVPKFGWGAIFADREAARFRKIVSAAAEITQLALPPDAARLLADQQLAEQTFVMWDLIHDRTHMHGDLPFDPFMIKQRMPYFLYTLEELRCDLTAFRESVRLEAQGVPHARLVQYAILFDRIFRFAITGSRVRNYDGLGGQLLFAWLHQHRVLHWTDNRLSIEWDHLVQPILELGRQIEQLYWQSIDRSKMAHWLAAYQLVAGTVAPHPLSIWAKGPEALPLHGPAKGLTDAVLADEFPLSMFYEALDRKLAPIVRATAGITG